MERKQLFNILMGVGIIGAIASGVAGTMGDFQGGMVSFMACIGLIIISFIERRK